MTTPPRDPRHPNRDPWGLGHNFLVFLLVSVIALYLYGVTSYNAKIVTTLIEDTGMRVHGLGLFLVVWALILFFLGGRKFDIVEAFRESATAFAILLAGTFIAIAIVISGH